MIGYHGCIEDFWSDALASYTYVREVKYEGVRSEWHSNFQGILLQSFDEELPEFWPKFQEALGVTTGSVGWINIRPNQIIPPHTDNFYMLRQKYNATVDDCLRYLIFLEDWKFGQYVEFEDLSISKWKRGDVWFFNYKSKHWAVNASNDDLHTCQVSTIKRINHV